MHFAPDAAAFTQRHQLRHQIHLYGHCIHVSTSYNLSNTAPELNPAPAAASNTKSPACTRSLRTASSSAIGMDAEDVLP
jgi:hypothetical protein